MTGAIVSQIFDAIGLSAAKSYRFSSRTNVMQYCMSRVSGDEYHAIHADRQALVDVIL